MSVTQRNNRRKDRRSYRVRQSLRRSELPRVSVFRSLNNIYAQVIDDSKHITIASCSTLEIKPDGDKTAQARAVGLELAKRAKDKGVDKVKFDRGPFLYHGRVKALADALRDGGLNV